MELTEWTSNGFGSVVCPADGDILILDEEKNDRWFCPQCGNYLMIQNYRDLGSTYPSQ